MVLYFSFSTTNGYYYNQFSDTCYKRIKLEKSWFDAKQHCEEEIGVRFAEFQTAESFEWLRMMYASTGCRYLSQQVTPTLIDMRKF